MGTDVLSLWSIPVPTGVGDWKQGKERNIGWSSPKPLREQLQQGGVGVHSVQGYSSANLRNAEQAWSWEDVGSLTKGC